MGGLTGFSLVVFAYGPALVMLLGVVMPSSPLLIVTVVAALFELLALFFTAMAWNVITGLQTEPALTVVTGVILQEAMRLAFLKVYVRGEGKVRELCEGLDKSPFSDFSSAIAGGVGFGLIYSLVLYGGVIQASLAPGDYFTEECPMISGFVLHAILALVYQVLNTVLMVIMLDGLRKTTQAERVMKIALCFAIHLAASLFSLFNNSDIGCTAGVTLPAAMAIFASIVAYRITCKPSYGEVL
mmetsp:Transcript_13908/g.25741  ORF Transcript_13908/g.25741 Transcript_13908/m.25741 type:complete len:242 (-) Transcript_13908:233-958(-)|eukprot:CAMPEP_0184516084 /NCGR_PEP_ID=MMETSP0198_2-20121128/4841_1 /TAXON_ID=1112570 /ORGANISM="Thraustochytrium sp., Strain LLF1b" /LENGTH=241 /DNA_ID=CAMNT_0026906383 /DNA_START=64 /DNA_END=789 /DNA_ORIENTATION=-